MPAERFDLTVDTFLHDSYTWPISVRSSTEIACDSRRHVCRRPVGHDDNSDWASGNNRRVLDDRTVSCTTRKASRFFRLFAEYAGRAGPASRRAQTSTSADRPRGRRGRPRTRQTGRGRGRTVSRRHDSRADPRGARWPRRPRGHGPGRRRGRFTWTRAHGGGDADAVARS